MTVNSPYEPAKYTGNGSTVDFTYSFPIGVASYLEVYLEVISTGVQTLQSQGSDYTLVFDETGGTITFASAPTSLQYVIISRNVVFEQQVSLTTSKTFDPKVIEGALDKLTEQTQQLKEFNSRVPSYPLGSSITNLIIPTPSANKALVWNSSANALENSSYDPDEQVANAAAQAVLALGYSNDSLGYSNDSLGYSNDSLGYSELSEDWAIKIDGQVASTDYSSKAYALGGTGVTSVLGSSKEWAVNDEDDEVITGKYSSLHYAAKAAASAATIAFLSANTTVNFTSSMTTAEMQALIDAQPKNLNGKALTFQFADGTYTLTATLNFNCFYGGYIYIKGNTGENVNSLHTNQAVIIDGSSVLGHCLFFNAGFANIVITNLKITPNTNAGVYTGIWSDYVGYFFIGGCYILGNGKTSGSAGIYANADSFNITYTYLSNTYYGLALVRNVGVVVQCDDTGTAPTYGIYSDASFVGLNSNLIAGTTASFQLVNGGIVNGG